MNRVETMLGTLAGDRSSPATINEVRVCAGGWVSGVGWGRQGKGLLRCGRATSAACRGGMGRRQRSQREPPAAATAAVTHSYRLCHSPTCQKRVKMMQLQEQGQGEWAVGGRRLLAPRVISSLWADPRRPGSHPRRRSTHSRRSGLA